MYILLYTTNTYSAFQRFFGVSEIRASVGSRRVLDVVDCETQKHLSMTLKDWHRYFEGKDRSRLLDVTNLEFSSTTLEPQITSPRIVRQIDWIDKAWPRHLKELQLEAASTIVRAAVAMETGGS